MLKTDFSPIQNLHIINNFKYDVINRVGDLDIEGTADQKRTRMPADLVTSSTIHKIDYSFSLADFRVLPDIYLFGTRLMREKRIKEFRLQPQFKFENTYYTATFTRNNGGHSYRYFPVLRFPGFMETVRDSGWRYKDLNRRRMFLGFETTTLYQGFNLLVTSGVRRTKESWVKSYGRTETGYTDYFIELRCEASK